MQEIKWEKEYDVVIAGYGGSGISAAITAHDHGAKVIILEKAPFPGGGQTRTSGLGACFVSDPEGAARYLHAMCSIGLENADVSTRLSVTPLEDCLILMKELARNPDWLASMGVDHSLRKGSSVAYDHFPGADSFGHVVIKGWGIKYLESMKNQLERRGIEVLYETPVIELVQDLQTREIKGVIAEKKGKEVAIKAQKGVVLCTGGFEFNEEMKANYLRPFPLKFAGWPYNTGDGIRMAQRAGADLWHMNTFCGYLNIWVPEYKPAWLLRFFHGIWVNRYGKRFTSEYVPFRHNWWLKNFEYDLDEPGYTSVPTYQIFDEKVRKAGAISANSSHDPEYVLGIQSFPADLGGCPEGWSHDNSQEIQKGWIKKAGTIEELGRLIGDKMDPVALRQTIDTYNSYCSQGNDPEFSRPPQYLKPLLTPPFYAVALYPGGINTCGGPRRNGYGQVLDPYKKIIPRLYSAGEMGSLCGNIYAIGGLNAGEMMASGRLAGASIAALNNWD
ncbi:MAG: FAD-dependent oxidoreductase [Dehalococcoidales bacterium]|nr:FAD-dependent oxidoreductase [Dehalococcoidales bacterium]